LGLSAEMAALARATAGFGMEVAVDVAGGRSDVTGQFGAVVWILGSLRSDSGMRSGMLGILWFWAVFCVVQCELSMYR
jgi:hypothetical protein